MKKCRQSREEFTDRQTDTLQLQKKKWQDAENDKQKSQ